MFKNPFSNFCYCVFILFFVLSIPAFAQTAPSCAGTNGGFCSSNQGLSCPQNSWPEASSGCSSGGVIGTFFICRTDCTCPDGAILTSAGCEQCPAGQIPNTIIDGSGNHVQSCIDDPSGEEPECEVGEAIDPTSGTCAPSYDDPFECAGGAAGGTAVQNASGGYSCQVGDNYPCPAGTTPGTAFDGNGNSVNTCMADNGNSSSDSNSSSQSSSTGNDSSPGSGDDGGSGGDSSDGNQTGGSSSSASSNGSGGNGSSSSGQGGSASSAGAGQCDPTAKNYLECLNTKKLEIPSEKGSYDGTGGTSTEDRIGELEGELQDVVDQIKSEINDTVGVNLSSGGTLTDQCYQIMKGQVCFGWARWSQHLALITNAILAMAYIASFVIIMRQ